MAPGSPRAAGRIAPHAGRSFGQRRGLRFARASARRGVAVKCDVTAVEVFVSLGGRDVRVGRLTRELNPTPVDVRERTLTTSIDLEDWTCDLALVLEVAPFFGLGGREASRL